MNKYLSLIFLFLSTEAFTQLEFEVKYLSMYGKRQDTIMADFNSDGHVDLLSIVREKSENETLRWLIGHLYHEDSWFNDKPEIIIRLDDRACAIFLGDFDKGSGVEIGFISSDGAYIYSIEQNGQVQGPVKLVHNRTFFDKPTSHMIPIWQYRVDLDNNGLDDLILPIPNGYKIFFQTEKGRFGRISELEADASTSATKITRSENKIQSGQLKGASFIYEMTLPSLQFIDINADNRLDLVSIEQDVLTVFFQDKQGMYSSASITRSIISVLREPQEGEAMEYPNIYFKDLNNDKLPEMIIVMLSGRLGLIESLKTILYIHMGNGTGRFTAESMIVIDGISTEPQFVDMDLDGDLDMLIPRVPTGIMKKLTETFVFGDIAIDYEIFQFNKEKNKYDEPVFEKTIYVRVKDIENKDLKKKEPEKKDLERNVSTSIPAVYVNADFNRDKRPDMLVVTPDERIDIFKGQIHYGFTEHLIGFDKTILLDIKINGFPKYLLSYDFNTDGISDLVLFYSKTLGVAISQAR